MRSTTLLQQICSQVDQSSWRPHYSSIDEFEHEICNYTNALIFMLAGADGHLGDEEIEFIRSHMGLDVDDEEIVRHVADKIEWATTHVASPPKFFRVLVASDRARGTSLSQTTLGYIKTLCVLVIDCDGQTHPSELDLAAHALVPLGAYMQSKGIPVDTGATFDGEKREGTGVVVPASATRSLEELLGELHALVGIDAVKSDVSSMVNFIKVRRMREAKGIKSPPMSLHLVFTGNPGTGKTTVARLVAEIYRSLGVLSKGHILEVDRSSLVAGYVGQTALKVREVCEQAMGGILFIDEAYALTAKHDTDYGREAIDTLLKFMEDKRSDFVVIAAGYSQEMEGFLDSNPGLSSRFNKRIHFDDYSESDLFDIFVLVSRENGYAFDVPFARCLRKTLSELYRRREKNFGNGRVIRNLFERVVASHANRVAQLEDPTESQLSSFEPTDLN